jgi:hypothetical protein
MLCFDSENALKIRGGRWRISCMKNRIKFGEKVSKIRYNKYVNCPQGAQYIKNQGKNTTCQTKFKNFPSKPFAVYFSQFLKHIAT